MRVAIAQLDACTGAFRYNMQVAVDMAQAAADEGADLIVFPEYALSGGINEGIVWSFPFVNYARSVVDQFARKTPIPAVIGSLCSAADAGCEAGESGAFFCSEGEVTLLGADPDEMPMIEVDDVRIAVCLGFELEYDAPSESTDMVIEMASDTFDGDVSLPISEAALGEARERAATGEVWIIHCNLVGGQDERVFSGGSYIMSPEGDVVAGEFLFKQCMFTAETFDGEEGADEALIADPEESTEILWHALSLALHDYVTKNKFSDVVLGISGGIDSALTATLAVDALGAEHVHGVLLPGPFSSSGSITDAEALARNLGIDIQTVSIDRAYDAFKGALAEVCGGEVSGLGLENMQARIRMVDLMTISNCNGWLLLNTGNKSEAAVGFSTLYGDTAGAFAPFGDIYKTQIYELAKWRNEDGAPIPTEIIDKPPSAELYEGARDEDRIPPYDVLDAIVSRHVEGGRSMADLILEGFDGDLVQSVLEKVAQSEFKRRQEPLAPEVSGASFRFRDWPITNRYVEKQLGSPFGGRPQ